MNLFKYKQFANIIVSIIKKMTNEAITNNDIIICVEKVYRNSKISIFYLLVHSPLH